MTSRRSRVHTLALFGLLACRRETTPGPSAPASGSDPVAATPSTDPSPSGARPWRDALRTNRLAIRVPDFTPMRGAAEPLVTIVQFGDYTDANSVAQAKVIAAAVAQWPEDIRVAFIHVPQPRMPLAKQLAQVAAAAGAQHHFWEAHDRLFAAPVTSFEAVPKALAGLDIDVTAAVQATNDGVHKPWLAGSVRSARDLGVARPGVVMVNGRSPDDVELGKLISDERDTMLRLVDQGLPRRDIYPEVLASASIPVALAGPAQRGALDPSVNYAVPVAGRPVLGPLDAMITVTVFSDFQCPFCAKAHQLCSELRRRHPEDVRCAFHNLPLSFHPKARELARAALAADGQGKFWPMHDAIFAGDASANDGWKKAAKRAKVNTKKLARAMASPEVELRIADDERVAASVGVAGTPTFFVNGRAMPGANDIAAFEALIAEELPKARAFASRDPGGEGSFYDRMIEEFVTTGDEL